MCETHSDNSQPSALAEAAPSSRDLSGRNPRSKKDLTKCLAFLVEKQIPQAENDVEQRRRATKGVSTTTMMHRVYYDRAVNAQHGLDWLKEARETIEKALGGGAEIGEYDRQYLEHVKSVALRMMKVDEAKEWCMATVEEG